MSDILIKGMEMPKSCWECRLESYCTKWLHPLGGGKEKRHPDCPLVPVPPHGRLIDGDVAEVISFTDEDARGGNFADGVMYAVDFISEMPTVIEAEEGE